MPEHHGRPATGLMTTFLRKRRARWAALQIKPDARTTQLSFHTWTQAGRGGAGGAVNNYFRLFTLLQTFSFLCVVKREGSVLHVRGIIVAPF